MRATQIHFSGRGADASFEAEGRLVVKLVLERGFPIRTIKHEGLELPKHDFDRMVKPAARMLASKHLCASLSIKPEEEKYRFGFTA